MVTVVTVEHGGVMLFYYPLSLTLISFGLTNTILLDRVHIIIKNGDIKTQ